MQWKRIPNYNLVGSYYEAGEDGSIRNAATGQLKKFNYNERLGYSTISLQKDGKSKVVYVHLAIATAWLGPRPKGMIIDHIDGDREDNSPSNLRYISRSANAKNI